MNLKKVLLVTYYWPPCGGAAVQRWLKMSKYFHEFGVELLVVTVNDRFASYPLFDNTLMESVPEEVQVYRTNTIEPLSIYKKLKKNKKIPHSGFANEVNPNIAQKVARFIRGNLFIPDARVLWNYYAYKECVKLIKKHEISAIITNSPPHSTQLVGLKLKKKFNIPWIVDFRDPWTDIFYYNRLYHTTLASAIDKKYERNVIENASIIMVVGNSLKEDFSKKTKLDVSEKFRVIPNGFNIEDFSIDSNPPQDVFRLIFTGSLSLNYNISCAIKAISEVINKNADIPVQIMFVGEVNSEVDLEFNKYGISKEIVRVGFVPHKESIRFMMNSSALLLSIYPSIRNKSLLSAKVFEYLAVKKPIICIGPEDGDVSKIIDECGAGKVLDYNNYDGIKEYFQNLLDRWKQNYNLDFNGNVYLRYSRKELVRQIVNIINNL